MLLIRKVWKRVCTVIRPCNLTVFQRSRGPSYWHDGWFLWIKQGWKLLLGALDSTPLLQDNIRRHPGSTGRTTLIYAAWMLRDARQVWGDAGGAASGHRPGGAGQEVRYEGRSSGGYTLRHFIIYIYIYILIVTKMKANDAWRVWCGKQRTFECFPPETVRNGPIVEGFWSQNEPWQISGVQNGCRCALRDSDVASDSLAQRVCVCVWMMMMMMMVVDDDGVVRMDPLSVT